MLHLWFPGCPLSWGARICGRGEKARGSGPGPADANLVSAPSLQSAIPSLIAVVVLDSSLFVTYVVAVAAGISVAAAFLLPW